MKLLIRKLLLLLPLLLCSSIVNAEIAIVVHPTVADIKPTTSQITNIFLGKSHKLPNGTKVIPVDQEEGETVREAFYIRVVRKDSSQLNAYWSRLIFTGKGQPPKVMLDDEDVLEWISNHSTAIGYINAESVDDRVKVILTIK